jgi:hypothetical protein
MANNVLKNRAEQDKLCPLWWAMRRAVVHIGFVAHKSGFKDEVSMS